MQQNGNKLPKCDNFGYVVSAKEMQTATRWWQCVTTSTMTSVTWWQNMLTKMVINW